MGGGVEGHELCNLVIFDLPVNAARWFGPTFVFFGGGGKP